MNDQEIITVANIPKLPARQADAHKGDFGKLCIIAGSVGMSGAAAIAGKSSLRSGAGLVRVATAKSALPLVAAIEPSYTTIALAEDSSGRISSRAVNQILGIATENDAMAIGPGIGISHGLRGVIESLIHIEDMPLLIDADGLNNLCKIGNWPEKVKAGLIVTPHPGEMKRLWCSISRDPIPGDRKGLAVEFARRTNTVTVLKGAGTVVSDGNKVYVNGTGNPGMATAGSGDCLTGVITALTAQGLSRFDAAVVGTYVHGIAGDIAAKEKGQISMIATDIVEALPQAFLSLA